MPDTAGTTSTLVSVASAVIGLFGSIAVAFIPALAWRSAAQAAGGRARVKATGISRKAIAMLSTAEKELRFQLGREPINAALQRIVAELDPAAQARLALEEHFFAHPPRFPTLTGRVPPAIEQPRHWADKVDLWRGYSRIYMFAVLVTGSASLLVNSSAASRLLNLEKITGTSPMLVLGDCVAFFILSSLAGLLAN